MAMNQDGELELVLGNKQLFSMFFIVVVLLGICFLMGYVVGKNSAPVLNAAIAPKESPGPLVIPPATEPRPEPEVTKEDPEAANSEASKAEPAKAEPVKTAAARPEPVKTEPAKQAKIEKQAQNPLPGFQSGKSATNQAPLSSQPLPGRVYLQLSATDRDPAEAMADLLRSKGFSAIAAQIPERKELYRVLVGPLSEADIPSVRANLKSNNFPSDQAVRRVF